MKKGLKICLGALLIIAIVLVYHTNYSYFTQPPSEKWSKEVKVSSGDLKSKVGVTTFNSNYIVVHDDGNSIKIVETDLLGKVLKENKIETGKFMNSITTFSDGKNLFVSYVEPNKDSGDLYTITLNEELKEVKTEKTKDVKSIQRIDDEMLIIVYTNKLEIINSKTGDKIVENAVANKISATKNLEGSYLITYNVAEKYLALKVKNNEIVERYSLGESLLSTGTAVKNISGSSDENHIYVLIEMIDKGKYGKMKIMSYAKDTKTSTIDDLVVNNEDFLYNSAVIKSKDNSAEFLINAGNNFLDVKFKNDKINEVHKVTRLVNGALNIGIDSDVVVFTNGEGLSDVYLASTDEKFRNVNNANNKDEAKYAFSISITNIINDIIMTPLYAALPIVLSSIPMILSLLLFLDGRHRNKRRVVLIFSYIMMITIKVRKAYELCFIKNMDILPKLINKPIIFTILMVFISSICMYLAYVKFEENENGIDLVTFFMYGSVDIFITTMFYLPYIA